MRLSIKKKERRKEAKSKGVRNRDVSEEMVVVLVVVLGDESVEGEGDGEGEGERFMVVFRLPFILGFAIESFVEGSRSAGGVDFEIVTSLSRIC